MSHDIHHPMALLTFSAFGLEAHCSVVSHFSPPHVALDCADTFIKPEKFADMIVNMILPILTFSSEAKMITRRDLVSLLPSIEQVTLARSKTTSV